MSILNENYIYIIDYNSGLAKGLSSWNPRRQQKPIEPVPCITITSFLHLFVANILRTHKTNSTCDLYSNMFTDSSVKTNSGNIQATHVHFTVTNIMLVQYVMYHDYDYILQLARYSKNNRIWISSNLILLISMPIHGRAAFKGLLSFAPSIIHRTLHGGLYPVTGRYRRLGQRHVCCQTFVVFVRSLCYGNWNS